MIANNFDDIDYSLIRINGDEICQLPSFFFSYQYGNFFTLVHQKYEKSLEYMFQVT